MLSRLSGVRSATSVINTPATAASATTAGARVRVALFGTWQQGRNGNIDEQISRRKREKLQMAHSLKGRGSEGRRTRGRGVMPAQQSGEVLLEEKDLPQWQVFEEKVGNMRGTSGFRSKLNNTMPGFVSMVQGLLSQFTGTAPIVNYEHLWNEYKKENKTVEQIATENGHSVATVRGALQLHAMELQHIDVGIAPLRRAQAMVDEYVKEKNGSTFTPQAAAAANKRHAEANRDESGLSDSPVEVEADNPNVLDSMGPPLNDEILEAQPPLVGTRPVPKPDTPFPEEIASLFSEGADPRGRVTVIERSEAQRNKNWTDRSVTITETDGTTREATEEELGDLVRSVPKVSRRFDFRYAGTKKWKDIRHGLRDPSVPFFDVEGPAPGDNEFLRITDLKLERNYQKYKYGLWKQKRNNDAQKEAAAKRKEAGQRYIPNPPGTGTKKYYQRNKNVRWGKLVSAYMAKKGRTRKRLQGAE